MADASCKTAVVDGFLAFRKQSLRRKESIWIMKGWGNSIAWAAGKPDLHRGKQITQSGLRVIAFAFLFLFLFSSSEIQLKA